MAEFHLKCEKRDISEYIILVGNPQRANKISSLLKSPALVNENRGLFVYTGFYRETRITVATTGMGAPSTAIVLEELANLGGKVFIRVGSAGGIDPKLDVGDVVIATGSIRDDGTSPLYLRSSFPAVPNFDVLQAMIATGKRIKENIEYGIVIAEDAFYIPYSREEMDCFVKSGVKAIEMESGCVFIVSQYRNVKAGAIFALDGNVALNKIKPEGAEDVYKKGEAVAIQIGLESLCTLSKNNIK